MRVIVGSRDKERARSVVASWGVAADAVEADDYAAAVSRAGVIVLTVPFTSVDPTLAEINAQLGDGSIVIDVTVPIDFAGGRMSMLDVAEGSAAQHIRTRLPAHVELAVAFKTIPARLLGDFSASFDCDEFVCGDSDRAREQAAALVRALPGLRPVDIGPLSRARYIEHMTALAVAINRKHKVHDARFRVLGLR